MEKGGFREERLSNMLRDNERGVNGFMDAMKVQVTEGHIKLDFESKKNSVKLDTDLLVSGIFFR